jgi:hypothetical protein
VGLVWVWRAEARHAARPAPYSTSRSRAVVVKLETTSLYAQVSIRELKRLLSALHPLLV